MKRILFLMAVLFAATLFTAGAQNKIAEINVTLDYTKEYVVQTKTRVLYDTVTKTVTKLERVVNYRDTTVRYSYIDSRTKTSTITGIMIDADNYDGYLNPTIVLADGSQHPIDAGLFQYTDRKGSLIGMKYKYREYYTVYRDTVISIPVVTYIDVPVEKTEVVKRTELYLDTTKIEKPGLTDWVCLDARRVSVASPTQFLFVYNYSDKYCIKLYNETTGKAYWFRTNERVYRKFANRLYKPFDTPPTKKAKLSSRQFRLSYDDYNQIENCKAYRTANGAANYSVGIIAKVKLNLRCVSEVYNTDGAKQYYQQNQQTIPVAISVQQ